MILESKMRALLGAGELDLPFPGSGATAARHRRLAEFARQDVSLARLIEAHSDAIAILAEAGRSPVPDSLYGVWASELPEQPLRLEKNQAGWRITGRKSFCSGANIVDRALVTIRDPQELLVDVGLRKDAKSIAFSESGWVAMAFAQTNTATADFKGLSICDCDILGPAGWYLSRPGFWTGACGPAACWAGGAVGLIDYAELYATDNAHNLAHLGGMEAAHWAMFACLEAAGNEIDADPADRQLAMRRALRLRHVMERLCSDVLERFGRVCGPWPLAFDAGVSRRYQEVQLYLRQCHGERDLELLGRQISKPAKLR